MTLACITPGKSEGCSPGILIDHVYALNEEETAHLDLLFLSPTAADLLRNHIGWLQLGICGWPHSAERIV